MEMHLHMLDDRDILKLFTYMEDCIIQRLDIYISCAIVFSNIDLSEFILHFNKNDFLLVAWLVVFFFFF